MCDLTTNANIGTPRRRSLVDSHGKWFIVSDTKNGSKLSFIYYKLKIYYWPNSFKYIVK